MSNASMSEVEFSIDEIEQHGTEVGKLRDGDWFATSVTVEHGTKWATTTGRVKWKGLTSVAVVLDGGPDKGEVIYWCEESKVIPLPKPAEVVVAERAEMQAAQIERERKQELAMAKAKAAQKKSTSTSGTKLSDTVAAAKSGGASPAATKALQARYDFQNKKFQEAIENDNAEALDAAQLAIERIEKEAKEKGVALVMADAVTPSDPDPDATEEVEEVEAEEEEEAEAEEASGASGSRSVQEKNKLAERASKLAAEKAARPAGATRAKKAVKLRPCLDGCGEMVPGNFKMGHDAKLKSLLIKIERGDESVDQVPDVAQDLIKFKKGELITEKDEKGKVTSKVQQYIITAAPVKFPGRPEIAQTKRDD